MFVQCLKTHKNWCDFTVYNIYYLLDAELLDVDNMRLYTYKDLQTATQDFNPDTKIGQGGFGSVYKVIHKS